MSGYLKEPSNIALEKYFTILMKEVKKYFIKSALLDNIFHLNDSFTC